MQVRGAKTLGGCHRTDIVRTLEKNGNWWLERQVAAVCGYGSERQGSARYAWTNTVSERVEGRRHAQKRYQHS